LPLIKLAEVRRARQAKTRTQTRKRWDEDETKSSSAGDYSGRERNPYLALEGHPESSCWGPEARPEFVKLRGNLGKDEFAI